MEALRASTRAPATTEDARRTEAFLDLVFPHPRQIAVRLWDGSVLPADGEAVFTLVLRSPGTLRRMFKVPVELSLGEAYLRGDFEVEGDLAAAFSLPHIARGVTRSASGAATLLAAWLRLPDAPAVPVVPKRDPSLLDTERERTRDRDRAAIQYHYDVGNDFYRLFLCSEMIYSCAYFTAPDVDLDRAQLAKLEHIGRKLRLRPGEQLLDIGCGWGALLIYMTERFGVDGVGVTLSEEQHTLATERVAAAGLSGRVRIELRDYRDLVDGSFDKIVSVGMFEHVGRDRFAEYFTRVFQLLRPAGLFLNHSIATKAEAEEVDARVGAPRLIEKLIVGNETFRKRYIFPDGELAPLSAANLVAERAGLEVRDVENLREHYALTLRHWLGRLRERRDEAVDVAGESVFRLWEMYLAGSMYHFETARLNINQTLFAKPDREGGVHLPLTRADIYERPPLSIRRPAE